jgi:hypothetical protein
MPAIAAAHAVRVASTALLLAAALSGCAVAPPGPGTLRSELLQAWGAPSAEHALPGGSQRLEYASGPYGRTTWMIDLDSNGRVQQARQVLNEAEFLAVMSTPNLRRAEVLQRLGAPGEVRRFGGAWGTNTGQIWSWRYPTNDCLWFELTLADDGRVSGGGYGPDPRCDSPSDKE